MKITGTIKTEFDVESLDVIKSLCQVIGVVDENGKLVAKLNNDNKIVKCWFDEWDGKHTLVLYDKPFDVQYASALIKLYELSNNYLMLEEHIKNRKEATSDYQTVSRLKIRKK